MGYLLLPGINGNYASTPDAAALDIVGDIEMIVRLGADDWTPAATEYLLAKRLSAGDQRSYNIKLNVAGTLGLDWSEDGTAGTLRSENVPITVSAGLVYWFRATIDISVSTIEYYISSDDTNVLADVAWDNFGSDANVPSSIHSGTADLAVGALSNGTNAFAGRVYRAIVRDGLGGTIVFDADFTDLTRAEVEAGSFIEDSVNAAVVTLNGSDWGYVFDPSRVSRSPRYGITRMARR